MLHINSSLFHLLSTHSPSLHRVYSSKLTTLTMRKNRQRDRPAVYGSEFSFGGASDDGSAIDHSYESNPRLPGYHRPNPAGPPFPFHPCRPVGGLPHLGTTTENPNEDELSMDPEHDEQEEVSTTPPTPAAGTIVLNTARPSTTVIPPPAPTTLNFSFGDSRTHVPIIVKISGDFKCHEIILVNPVTVTLSALENLIVETVRSSRSLEEEGNIRKGSNIRIVKLCVRWKDGFLGAAGMKTNVHKGNVNAVVALLGKNGGEEALWVTLG